MRDALYVLLSLAAYLFESGSAFYALLITSRHNTTSTTTTSSSSFYYIPLFAATLALAFFCYVRTALVSHANFAKSIPPQLRALASPRPCAACAALPLRRDHHCPWVSNCIGVANAKYFVLLLFYTTLCLLQAIFHQTRAFSLTSVATRHTSAMLLLYVAFLLPFSLAVASALCAWTCVLFIYYLRLAALNRTSRTSVEKYAPTSLYDMYENVAALLGHPLFWLLPVQVHYASREYRLRRLLMPELEIDSTTDAP